MPEHESILSNCTSGGCGAKIGADALSSMLGRLQTTPDPRVIVGYDTADDAAVYQIDDTRAMISTVDFFSPMVDDPRTFGRIAAANALSDVYAMGGTPALALNLVCYPERMPLSGLEAILEGGADTLREASVSLGGGHSIYDTEPKYGLAVTGFVALDRLLRNNTPQPGDHLLLTKPLGVGIIMAAHRVGMADDEALSAAIASMQRLNRYAAEKLSGYAVHACTDVTGFGLLSHLLEMCGETASAEIDVSRLPILPHASAYADDYLLTAAGQRNRNHFGARGDVDAIPFAMQELLFDPQTSGGLLISVDAAQADALLAAIRRDDPLAADIGRILPRAETPITFVR